MNNAMERDCFGRFRAVRPDMNHMIMQLDCRGFENAIRSTGVCLAAAEVKELFYAMDVDENQNLDFNEFKNAVEVFCFFFKLA